MLGILGISDQFMGFRAPRSNAKFCCAARCRQMRWSVLKVLKPHSRRALSGLIGVGSRDEDLGVYEVWDVWVDTTQTERAFLLWSRIFVARRNGDPH